VWRWRIESEPSFAAVETLRAQSEAAALERHLEVEAGPKWWASPKAGELLREYWKTDTLPEPVRAYAASGESLLAALGAPQHGGVALTGEVSPGLGDAGNPSTTTDAGSLNAQRPIAGQADAGR